MPPTYPRLAQLDDVAAGSPRCAGCGCTNNVGCNPACWWVSGHHHRLAPIAPGQGRLDVDVDVVRLVPSVPLCSACAPDLDTLAAWPHPTACVAPSWPGWACDEDGETVWLRADLVGQAAALLIAEEVLTEDYRLAFDGPVLCTWDQRAQGDWPWMLSEVHADDAGDDVVRYARFTIGWCG